MKALDKSEESAVNIGHFGQSGIGNVNASQESIKSNKKQKVEQF